MATVKTTVDESGERRVITKLNEDGERRVSCSCCGEELTCCVFPASCGIAPAQIEFYGETLTGNGTTFGDTTNGVILESGAWAVYRNGVRSERDCLGLALPGFTTNVAAVLATSYSLSFELLNPPADPEVYTATLSYVGAILAATNPSLSAAVNQCAWAGTDDQLNQDFGEGFALFFNPSNCRWELADGPLGFLYAHGLNLAGAYTSVVANLDNFVIS